MTEQGGSPAQMATQPRFIGVDLAWGEGSSRRPANETGLAILDAHGVILDAGWARGIDAVAEWVIGAASPGDVIAVDAPLVLPNATGMRLAEREVGRGYGRWHVSANASNAAMPAQGGVTLATALERVGFVRTDGLTRHPPGSVTFFECYPYTTIVGVPELGYDTERPRYKRFDLTLPLAERRAARMAACDELIRRMATLDTADPPLDLRSHPHTLALIDDASPSAGPLYKHREDLLDAVLCAWTAAIWHRHGESRMQILGRSDAPDAAGIRPTILTAARDEQRVG